MMLIKNKIYPLVSILFFTQLAACSSDDKDKVNNLDWVTCEQTAPSQCSTIKVPIDYSDPTGEQMDIALIRHLATGTERKGALVFNPGGPGATGVSVLQYLADSGAIPDSILKAYDLVSFDPRGLGKSMPVDCTNEGLNDVIGYTFDASAVAEMHEQYSMLGEKCSTKYGEYLQHLGSLNVVRDMDKIRAGIGEAKLNFIGYSYGTRLAALYLQEYPENSGRIVLDASGYSDSPLRTLVSGQLEPKQANLLDALSLCKNTDPNCDPNALLSNIEERLRVIPTSEAEGRPFTLLLTIVLRIADDPEFGQFASAPLVEYLNTSDLSVIEAFIEQVDAMGDNEDDAPASNITAKIAVLCADDASRPDVQTLVSVLDEFNKISDVFAESLLPQLGICAGWPEALDPVGPITTNTAPLSLVIGGTSDGQAPLAASEEMASKIGGVFIRSNHFGHTAVFNDVSQCVDDIVETFLLDGMTPTVQVCE